MTHHPFAKRKGPFSATMTAKQPVITTSQPDNIQRTDGVLIKNKELILARWAEYLQSLLDKVHISDTALLGDLPTLPIIPIPCDPPSFDEFEKAILCLNDNKAAGPDNIPAWQHSDNILTTSEVLMAYYSRIWNWSSQDWPNTYKTY